jgi:excisionase family DNA binding protein
MKELPVFLTVKELAEMLRVKVRTLYSCVENDLILYHKPGRITIFRLDEIIEWLEKKRAAKKSNFIVRQSFFR